MGKKERVRNGVSTRIGKDTKWNFSDGPGTLFLGLFD
jgi:hypothetical protein